MTILNVFLFPLITIYEIYDKMGPIILILSVLYWRLWIEIIYRVYEFAYGELLLWYIPNLTLHSESGDNELFEKKQLIAAYQYHKWIHKDVVLINAVLIEFVGHDVAVVVISYLPDYLDMYKAKSTANDHGIV